MVPGDYIRPGDEKKHEEFMKEHEQYEKWMEEYRKTGKWPGPPNVPIRKEKKKD